MTADLLRDAMTYVERGISIIPMQCDGGAKKPAVRWKPYVDRLATKDEIRGWFARPNINGVAVIAGGVSGGLAVRDFDRADGYDQWRDTYPALARTLPTVRTSRGFHVWHNSDLLRVVKLADGEFRGAGISIAPHSVHPSGIRYEWIVPLPKRRDLPVVPHSVFLPDKPGRNVSEYSEAISDYSEYSEYSETSIEHLLHSTLPTKPGERNAKLLALARGLKFNAGMKNADADTLRSHVRRWHELALPVITTKAFDETWMDFLHAFQSARMPLGMNLANEAAARLDPMQLPEVCEKYDGEPMRRLAALCAEMAALNRGRFFLSSHDAAARLNVPQMTAWRMLRALCADGVIELAETGNERRANRYRWRGGEV